MRRKQSQLGEFVYLHAHCSCKGLNERTATRGAGLVEHYGIDGSVFNLEALYILTADIYYEVYVGVEVKGGLEVCNRLHYAEIGLDSRLDKVLAVPRYRTALYGYAARGQLVDFFEPFYDYIQRLTVVRLVVRIEYAAVGSN